MTRVSSFALLALLACNEGPTGPVPPSEWGGDHVGLILTVVGGDVEFDCAAGRLDQPVVLREGQFGVAGLFYPGVGGPIGVDSTRPRPARYEGVVTGERMKLVVRLLDTNETLGPFALERGRSPYVIKCL